LKGINVGSGPEGADVHDGVDYALAWAMIGNLTTPRNCMDFCTCISYLHKCLITVLTHARENMHSKRLLTSWIPCRKSWIPPLLPIVNTGVCCRHSIVSFSLPCKLESNTCVGKSSEFGIATTVRTSWMPCCSASCNARPLRYETAESRNLHKVHS